MIALLRNWKLIVGLILIGAVWYSGYKYGVYKIESKQAKVIQDYQKATNILAVELHRKQELLDKKSGAKVRTIYVEQDPTGCTDTPVPNGVFNALRGDTTGSELDKKLF